MTLSRGDGQVTLDPLVFGEQGPAQWDAHGPLRTCLEHEVTWRGFGECWECEDEAAQTTRKRR